MKRITCVFFVLIIIVNLFCISLICVNAQTLDTACTSGITGDCNWSLSGTTLKISGNGDMADYGIDDDNSAPWGKDITTLPIRSHISMTMHLKTANLLKRLHFRIHWK